MEPLDPSRPNIARVCGGPPGKTGFTITQANEESYLTTLANYMHGLGLAWIAKNLDDTGNATFVTDMQPLAQGIITEHATNTPRARSYCRSRRRVNG